MTDNHPITPPPELLQQWATEYWGNPGEPIGYGERYIAIEAARWGADRELEACIKLLADLGGDGEMIRRYRRPNPPSLSESALDLIDRIEFNSMAKNLGNEKAFGLKELEIVRRALKHLQELEGQGDD